MKKIVSLLLLLSLVASVILGMVSCITPAAPDDLTPDDNLNPGEQPDDPNTPDDPVVDPTPADPTDNPSAAKPAPDDPRAADYSYASYLPAEMPEIRVVTDDGSNDFALKINSIDQKWNNEIEYVGCTVSVGNCEEQYALSAKSQIKVRGNYTVTFPKQPFRLKFEKKQNLLGMNDGNKYKSWVLLADWKDSSMLQNLTSYFLAKNILGSDGYYSTDYRLVKLYLNDIYWGVYLLAEQQQTGEGRVDIAEPEDDYTGTDIGYFFEYDGYHVEEAASGGDPTFTIPYNDNAPLKEHSGATADSAYYRGYTIKSDIYADAQTAFIQKWMTNAYIALSETVINGNIYTLDAEGNLVSAPDMTEEEAVKSIVDVQSLVDTYILNEICCDYDLHWSSFYMSVDMSAAGNKKLTFCAPWDFDTAFGAKDSTLRKNNPGETKYSDKYACENARGIYAGNNRNPWMLLLVNEDWFTDAVKVKWAEVVRYDVLERARAQMDYITTIYEEEMIENATRKWDEKWQGQYKGGYTYQVGDPCPDSWKELVGDIASCKTQAQASARLWGWFTRRVNYLNEVWGDGSNVFK